VEEVDGSGESGIGGGEGGGEVVEVVAGEARHYGGEREAGEGG